MSNKAKELLKKLLEEYERTKEKEFPRITLSDYSDDVINELENNYYITKKPTILNSIVLTDKALEVIG